MTNRKYLFLYLKTGGGHLAPARSVRSYLQTRYAGTIEPILVDGLEQAPRMIRFLLEDGYKHLQAYAQWLYALLYFLNKLPLIARFNTWIVGISVMPYLEQQILVQRPEKIVIFHFFLIKPVKDILARHGLAIPTLVVVTDPFTAHPLWFLDMKHRFIVFSDRLRDHCVRLGVEQKDVSVFPFVLDEKFNGIAENVPAGELKARLGFDPMKKLILIIGGADGMPRGKRLVKGLLKTDPEAEIAIVCGRNKRLRDKLVALKHRRGCENLKVLGYVSHVHELLRASDAVITKCGASICMETLLARKIPIVNNYLWEQEKGNVEFLCGNQIGIYERKIANIPAWIHTLLTDSQSYDRFNRNIDRAHLVNGVDMVSAFIMNFGTA